MASKDLLAESWDQDTFQEGTFWVVLNGLFAAYSAQLGRVPTDLLWSKKRQLTHGGPN